MGIQSHEMELVVLWAVLLAGALASQPVQLDSMDAQPRVNMLPKHPSPSVRQAEKEADTMVSKSYNSKHTASSAAEKLLDVEAAITSLDEVATARQAHLNASAAKDLKDLATLEQQSAATNTAADQNLTATVAVLKEQTRNITESLALNPDSTNIKKIASADANATKELKLNIDIATKENAGVLKQADTRIHRMHANELKYKHVEDMARAKSRENLRKFCKFVYGKQSSCKHPDSNGQAWSQTAQKWKKAGKPMHDAAQWALLLSTMDDVKKSITPQNNFGSWGTQPTSQIRDYLKEHHMHLEPNNPVTSPPSKQKVEQKVETKSSKSNKPVQQT